MSVKVQHTCKGHRTGGGLSPAAQEMGKLPRGPAISFRLCACPSVGAPGFEPGTSATARRWALAPALPFRSYTARGPRRCSPGAGVPNAGTRKSERASATIKLEDSIHGYPSARAARASKQIVKTNGSNLTQVQSRYSGSSVGKVDVGDQRQSQEHQKDRGPSPRSGRCQHTKLIEFTHWRGPR